MRPLVILSTAALTLAAADLVAGRLAPPRRLAEVEDAVAALRRTAPTTLVIGSSHARTFLVVGDSLRARSGGREELLAVPVEWGKLSSYRWVLERRLLPLLDADAGDGAAPRGRRWRRAVIVTEWWDSCPLDAPPRNLPARAWTWADYLADVRTHGFTAYNDNFIGYRWSRLWRRSALVQDRGHGRILAGARAALLPGPEERRRAGFETLVALWRGMVEDGDRCIGARSELEALGAMLDTLRGRGVAPTILLYPRMPVTLTPKARRTTLPRFAGMVDSLARGRDVPVVDLTTGTPLTDDDFGGDFDHILPPGNARFTAWALAGPLAFLADPP